MAELSEGFCTDISLTDIVRYIDWDSKPCTPSRRELGVTWSICWSFLLSLIPTVNGRSKFTMAENVITTLDSQLKW